jgi:hypothetical protein
MTPSEKRRLVVDVDDDVVADPKRLRLAAGHALSEAGVDFVKSDHSECCYDGPLNQDAFKPEGLTGSQGGVCESALADSSLLPPDSQPLITQKVQDDARRCVSDIYEMWGVKFSPSRLRSPKRRVSKSAGTFKCSVDATAGVAVKFGFVSSAASNKIVQTLFVWCLIMAVLVHFQAIEALRI